MLQRYLVRKFPEQTNDGAFPLKPCNMCRRSSIGTSTPVAA